MTSIQAILQLPSVGLSQREITRRLYVDRGVVSNSFWCLTPFPKFENRVVDGNIVYEWSLPLKPG